MKKGLIAILCTLLVSCTAEAPRNTIMRYAVSASAACADGISIMLPAAISVARRRRFFVLRSIDVCMGITPLPQALSAITRVIVGA